MNVLWIVNVELPKIAERFGRTNVYAGWLETMSKQLAENENINLYVAGVTPVEYRAVIVDGISYYGFENGKEEKLFRDVIENIKPDIIHVWGTEYVHIKPLLKVLKATDSIDKTVVSIQGLVSECSKYYNAGLPADVINKNVRIGRIKRTSLKQESLEMGKRGENEVRFFKEVKHCIGRTSYDKNVVTRINPEIKYHYCSESMREPFYDGAWDYDKCEKNKIFFSQTHWPLKGVHECIRALGIVKKEIQDIHLNALGHKPLSPESIRLKSYDEYLDKLIRDNNLEDSINWLGTLTAEQMKGQYLKANIFVCSSALENSSNSVAEAMLLGVPVIASDVGGMRDIISDGEDGVLYQHESERDLQLNIIKALKDNKKAAFLGENAKKHAGIKYNREENLKALLKIYSEISNSK